MKGHYFQRLVSMSDKWFYAAGKWFYAAGSYRLLLCIRMGIIILKIIIWGGISSDMRSEVTFLALLTCHQKTKFSFQMSNDNHPK